jgi:DNA ligase D-like protein (predicted ligase)
MLLLSSETLPDAENWSYELKLDGYRALGIKADGRVQLRSRNNKDFAKRYPSVAKALEALPADTVVDGEIVALDEQGRPSFNLLQNYQSAGNKIFYFLFDVLALSGRNVINLPLRDRRVFLHSDVLPNLGEPIRECPVLNASLTDVIHAIRKQGLEGIVAKNLDSLYEPGERSGSWRKMRINKRQEFVIGGYTVGARTFDALIFGYYEGARLLYAGRTRNGFTPELREQLQRRFRALEIAECPFSNLPEENAGRWGAGLTTDKMKECRWLRPELVGQFEFVEWTPDNHLRHSRFVGLRQDVDAALVYRR